jgi:hypothetical protein
MTAIPNVTESLRTLKASIDTLLKQRLDKMEAVFHRQLGQLENRLARLEVKQDADGPEVARVSQKCDAEMKALNVRLTIVERTLSRPVGHASTSKRIERDPATGAISRIVDE